MPYLAVTSGFRSFSYIGWLFLSSWFLVGIACAAEILIDTRDSQRAPSLTQVVASDIPQINIVGLQGDISYNQFTQFNVGPQGVVISNNPFTEQLESLGRVKANSNLSTRAAKTIVFAVTGQEQSELRGTTRVVGEAATFILVNPNGIKCDGCGFTQVGSTELRTDNPLAIEEGRVIWEKDLEGEIYIGREGITAGDRELTLSGGKIKIEGAVAVKKLWRAEAHGEGASKGVLPQEAAADYKVTVATVALVTAENIYLITTGAGAGIKITAPEITIPNANSTLPQAIYVAAQDGNVAIAGELPASNANLKIVGRELVNTGTVKGKNIELSLSGDFINEGNIYAEANCHSTSVGITNYQNIQIGDRLQLQGEYLSNDKGAHLTAKTIEIYLRGKNQDGYSLYQGGNSVMEAGSGGMELVAPQGNIYFGYKKEPTGAGDNGDGFIFTGSQLLSNSGTIHIQAGGDVVFAGTQVAGDIIVEAQGEIKELTPLIEKAYQEGTIAVVKQENRERVVIIPVTKTRQVFDHWHEWCPSGINIFGCIGGPKREAVYRTESYIEEVPTKENYVVDVTVKRPCFKDVVLPTKFSGNKQLYGSLHDLEFKKAKLHPDMVIPVKQLTFLTLAELTAKQWGKEYEYRSEL